MPNTQPGVVVQFLKEEDIPTALNITRDTWLEMREVVPYYDFPGGRRYRGDELLDFVRNHFGKGYANAPGERRPTSAGDGASESGSAPEGTKA